MQLCYTTPMNQQPLAIFRCEYPSGSGPFTTGHGVPNRWRMSSRHFQPDEDGLPSLKRSWHYGCPTLKAVMIWFGDNIICMREMGLMITIYESREYKISKSGNQVMFNRANATKQRTMTINEFIEYLGEHS